MLRYAQQNNDLFDKKLPPRQGREGYSSFLVDCGQLLFCPKTVAVVDVLKNSVSCLQRDDLSVRWRSSFYILKLTNTPANTPDSYPNSSPPNKFTYVRSRIDKTFLK